jgi:AraC family transcriptional regulator, transcriptional activator of pobA
MDDAYVPHRHDHYTCMLLEEGELDVLMDGQPLSMQRWTLFISYPDQVHQVLRSKNGKGWYLSFSNHLVDESIRSTLDHSIADIVSVILNAEEFKWYSALITSMLHLPAINHSAHSEVARLLLEAFLAQALQTQHNYLQISRAGTSKL